MSNMRSFETKISGEELTAKDPAKKMPDWEEHAIVTGDYSLNSYLRPGDTVRDPSLHPEEGGSRPEFDYVTSYGQLERVTLDVGTYKDGGLCVTMESFDEDMGERVRFADVTMKTGHLPAFAAAINIESHDDAVMDFLEENGFGVLTGEFLRIGERSYPVFRFNEERLREADSRGFEKYFKSAGIELKPKQHAAGGLSFDGTKKREESLQDLVQTAKERAEVKNLGHSKEPADRSSDLSI